MKHGEGDFIWQDGCSYKGSLIQNLFQGHGVYIWSNGKKYDGEWLNGKKHGKGR